MRLGVRGYTRWPGPTAPLEGQNTDEQDQLSPGRHIRLATHGRSIQMCQKATFALQQIFLFDHLVGAGEERRWHSNAKRLGGFHIDDQLETSWLLDRQIGGLGAFEDFVDVHGSLMKKV